MIIINSFSLLTATILDDGIVRPYIILLKFQTLRNRIWRLLLSFGISRDAYGNGPHLASLTNSIDGKHVVALKGTTVITS